MCGDSNAPTLATIANVRLLGLKRARLPIAALASLILLHSRNRWSHENDFIFMGRWLFDMDITLDGNTVCTRGDLSETVSGYLELAWVSSRVSSLAANNAG